MVKSVELNDSSIFNWLPTTFCNNKIYISIIKSDVNTFNI